ncbi:MAG: hypothetical protein JWM33_2203 [Caulobacteraceae bacterium]|nr:hypothetical protein [Caulobacteraceae bacterium]
MIGQLRYDAAPCKPALIMDPDSRLFWTSVAHDTIVLPIPAGCDDKAVAPVTAISDAVWGFADVKAVRAEAR